ncbi:LptF/LptG family permease [Fibrobacter sp. UWS1]|uniref:LptF/LptG family permease n=1 Tax=Fibrobacter sp. UWS1 TaxID=1896220 RepID=UPI000BB122F2|nr:LptF/LptG family permease [Fibrobacter sp. UWS1]PBC68544.1 lipopolysaccharide export system permease protein [Fibrobacter sp. UWS1]
MILVRYVLKEHIAPFLLALFVITFLFVVDFLVTILDNVLSKGLPISTVLEIFALNIVWMLSLSIPMAVLVACLMAFGRLSGDQEITAMKAAGVSPLRMMRPVLLVGVLISELLILFNNWILPEANHKSVELMSAVSRKKPHAFIDAGKLTTQFPGVQLWVDRIDPVTGTLYGIQIFETEGMGPPRVVLADSATMDYADHGATLMLRLKSGENHMVEKDDPAQYFRIRFSSEDFAVKNVNDRLERRDRKHRSDREMPVEMMLDVIHEAEKNERAIVQESRGSLFPDLNRLRSLVLGDSIIPRNENWELTSDSLRHVRALRDVSIAERTRLRLVHRTSERVLNERKRQAQYWVEVHKKFSTGVACFVFVLIGAPLGIMARKGGIGTGIIYSIAFFVLYWVCLIGGENLADRLIVSPVLAMWISNAIIGTVGVIFMWKMYRDRYSGTSPLGQFKNGVLVLWRKIRRKKSLSENTP